MRDFRQIEDKVDLVCEASGKFIMKAKLARKTSGKEMMKVELACETSVK